LGFEKKRGTYLGYTALGQHITKISRMARTLGILKRKNLHDKLEKTGNT
jgi:hypothetical protein